MICVQLTKPIKHIQLIDEPLEWVLEQTLVQADQAAAESQEVLTQQQKHLEQLCQTLEAVTEKLNSSWETEVRSHKEQIARLSVEIARKILAKQVNEGDYQIENIIQQALNDVPSGEDIQVHLSPADFEICKRFFEENPGHLPSNCQFAVDPKIQQAECRITCSKGIVNSIIHEQLEHIAELLTK